MHPLSRRKYFCACEATCVGFLRVSAKVRAFNKQGFSRAAFSLPLSPHLDGTNILLIPLQLPYRKKMMGGKNRWYIGGKSCALACTMRMTSTDLSEALQAPQKVPVLLLTPRTPYV